MKTLRMYERLKKRVLVTRGSARLIERDMSSALSKDEREVVLDFVRIEGVTPTFLDETLSILEEHISRANGRQFRIFIENSPTHLSSKYNPP